MTAARTDDSKGLEQLPSGRWRVKMRDPTTEAGWMPGGGPFASRDEAVRYRDGMRAVLAGLAADGALAAPDSLQTFAKTWLTDEELLGDLRSIDTLRSQWGVHLAGTELAMLPLGDITEAHVRTWLEGMMKKKALVPVKGGETTHAASTRRLNRDTISKVLVLLRGLLEAAREKGLCESNAARDVHVRKGSGHATSEDVWTYLTTAEIARLEGHADMPRASQIVFLVAIYTGLRQGELWGLHWRDVHLEARHPEVVVRYSHQGAPKNGKIRHVPLLAPARELLKLWLPDCPKRPDGLVFPTRTGERRGRSDDARWADYYVPRMVLQPDGSKVKQGVRVEGYSKRLQLGRHVRFHDLRHTCASHLIMGSWGEQWSLSEIAAFLGHSDTEVTERYAHLSPEHLHQKAARTAVRGTGSLFHVDPPVDEKQLARPRGIEPLTSRSVAPHHPEESRHGAPQMERPVEHARLVLEQAARGQLADDAIVRLARAVLATADERMHLAIALDPSLTPTSQADPLRVRRALQLAVAVLSADSAVSLSAASAASAASGVNHG